MNINATLFGQGILIIGLFYLMVVTAISYYLGKRKTNTPILIAIIGLFTTLIPPIALIFLIVLALKKDIYNDENRGAFDNV
jgi:Mn2+/Fe2+ NRAMP family transporter